MNRVAGPELERTLKAFGKRHEVTGVSLAIMPDGPNVKAVATILADVAKLVSLKD